MRTVCFSVFCAILVFVGLWCCICTPSKGVTTRTTTTVSLIAQILDDVDLWNVDDISAYGPLPEHGSDSEAINRAVAKLFMGCRDKAIRSGSLVGADGVFRDAWGAPLIFCLTNAPDYLRLNDDIKGKARRLVVWSKGPNQINEFGFGDDVVCHR